MSGRGALPRQYARRRPWCLGNVRSRNGATVLPRHLGRSARSGGGSSDSRWCSLIAPRIHGAIPAITGGCDTRFRDLSFSPLWQCLALTSFAWRKTGASKSGRSSVLAVAQAGDEFGFRSLRFRRRETDNSFTIDPKKLSRFVVDFQTAIVIQSR